MAREENSSGMVQGGTACRECEVCPVFFPGAGAFLSAMRVRVTGGGDTRGCHGLECRQTCKGEKTNKHRNDPMDMCI